MKRVIALVLTLAMILSCGVTSVFAAGERTEAVTVTFVDSGEVIKVVTVIDSGEVADSGTVGVKMPTDPVKEGYTFEGWFAAGVQDAFTSTTPVTESITVTAKWTKDAAEKYAVKFVGGEGATGTAPTQADTAKGETVTLPANTFVKTGYTFAKWNDGTTDYAAGATFTMPEKAVTFTATWTKDTDPAKVDAVAPKITKDLPTAEVSYVMGAQATALDATATVTDGGTVAYAWYKNTTATTDGVAIDVTTAKHVPSTVAAVTTYYYCVVTNTNAKATGTKTATTTSAIATITVTEEPIDPPAEADKTALKAAITAANTAANAVTVSTDGKDVEKTKKWILAADKTTYTTAIAAAQKVADKAEATTQEVAGAVTTLASATTAFKDAQKDGTKVDPPKEADKTALKAAIAIAETAYNDQTVEISVDGSDVAKSAKWVTPAAKDALKKAIETAKIVSDNHNETDVSNVANAKIALENATATFNAAQKDGTKEDPVTPPVKLNKKALTDAVNAADENIKSVLVRENGTEVSKGTKWVTPADVEAYKSAQDSAWYFVENDTTQKEIDDAVVTFAKATAAFNAAKKDGTKEVVKPTVPPVNNGAVDNAEKEIDKVKDMPTATEPEKTAAKEAVVKVVDETIAKLDLGSKQALPEAEIADLEALLEKATGKTATLVNPDGYATAITGALLSGGGEAVKVEVTAVAEPDVKTIENVKGTPIGVKLDLTVGGVATALKAPVFFTFDVSKMGLSTTDLEIRHIAGDGKTYKVTFTKSGDNVTFALGSFSEVVFANVQKAIVTPEPPKHTSSGGGGGGRTSSASDFSGTVDRARSATAGDRITVNIAKGDVVPATVMDAIAGKDITIVVYYDGKTYTVNGKTLKPSGWDIVSYTPESFIVALGAAASVTDNTTFSGGGTYVVKAGDSLWGIAQKVLGNGARYTQIKAANNMTSDFILPGQKLVLPQ